MSFKAHFRRALDADPGRLHFAAHSHHLWPDVTWEAQRQCWLDAACLADRKWDLVFGEIYPATQRRIAGLLNLSRPEDIAFAPNTHGLVMRLLSCLPAGRPIQVLTSDGEFHSFARQIARLEEEGLARVRRVTIAPHADFSARFAAAVGRDGFDLVYVSQVFYESGYALPDLGGLVRALSGEETLIVIDGYHGFLALPTDLADVEARAFYLAGGYKYAMAGEGAAFLHAPPGIAPRPRDTGWYADFGGLEHGHGGRGEGVAYPEDARRFLGATFDPVGLYRLNAVLGWLADLGIGVAHIHGHVLGLQRRFVAGLADLSLTALHPGQLALPVEENWRGHFLTFRTEAAGKIHDRLLARNVITDYRGAHLRIGFGLYHDEGDVDGLIGVLREELA